jgi:hypothetical protein
VPGVVELAVFEGIGTYYEVRVDGIEPAVRVLALRAKQMPSFAIGTNVWIGWRTADAPIVALND